MDATYDNLGRMPHVIADRQGVTFQAALLDLGSKGYGIAIHRTSEVMLGTWEGTVTFPRALLGIARGRFAELATDIDLEGLIREWGDPDGELLGEFIGFLGEEAEVRAKAHAAGPLGRAPVDELPDLVIPAEGLLRKIKPPKPAGKAKPAKAKPPVQPASVAYAPRAFPRPETARADGVRLLPLEAYDHIVVSFSGGKDSVACVLYLLELGVPASRIELWHQCVDGRPEVDERLFDWPSTESYCQGFADMFGMRLLFQWKEGGFITEMTKLDRATAPSSFQTLDGGILTAGGEGDPGTRLAFPALAANLGTRWCSAYLKIDVAKKVFTNDPRFADAKTLIVTGERREESGNRSLYEEAKAYSSTQRRTVHQWRAVLPWFEQDVWEIMARYRVRPHPAYYLGWSRVSCLPCIFGDPNQWATIREVAPQLFARLARLEDKFYVAARTVPSHPFAHAPNYNGWLRPGESLSEAAAQGTSYIQAGMEGMLRLAFAEHLPAGYVHLRDGEAWELPPGAYKHSGGPT